MFGNPVKVIQPEPRPRRFGNRDVVGTQPYEIGIVAKYPGDNWKAMQLLYEQRKGQSLDKDKELQTKNDHENIVRHEFDLLSDKKSLMNRLKHQVNASMEAAKRDLEGRRQNLRRILLEEESALTREYVNKCQQLHDQKTEEMKLKVLDIRNKREIKRKQIVHEKRIQQYIDRCEDLRSMRSKEERQRLRQAQEYQIKEKEMKKEQELQEERMWAAVAMKEYEAKIAKEIEDTRVKFRRDREAAEILMLQHKAIEENAHSVKQKVLDQEATMIKNLEKELKQEKIAELEMRLKKRENVYRDLREQIEIRENFLAQQAKDDKILDDTFSKVAKAEYDRELSARKDVREQLKRESQLYRDSLKELRNSRSVQEEELEKLLEKEMEKVDAERKERALRLKAAREKLKNDVLTGRKDQLLRRRKEVEELKLAEEREAKLTRDLRDMNERLEHEHDEQLRLLKRKYAKALLDQIEYANTLKNAEREEIERQWKAGILEENCYQRLIKELVSRHEELVPHPFYKVIHASVNLDDACVFPVSETTEETR